MAKLTHPNATGCSWGGVAFEQAEDGTIEVPDEAIADLAAHGFTLAPAAEPTEPAAAASKPAPAAASFIQRRATDAPSSPVPDVGAPLDPDADAEQPEPAGEPSQESEDLEDQADAEPVDPEPAKTRKKKKAS